MTLQQRLDNLKLILTRNQQDMNRLSEMANHFRQKTYQDTFEGYITQISDMNTYMVEIETLHLALADSISRMHSGEFTMEVFETLGIRQHDIYTLYTNWISYLRSITYSTTTRLRAVLSIFEYYKAKRMKEENFFQDQQDEGDDLE